MFLHPAIKTGSRPVINYPAQLNRPPEPQLLLSELPAFVPPNEAKLDTFLCVSSLRQVGQTGLCPVSDQRIIFSKVSPQLLQ